MRDIDLDKLIVYKREIEERLQELSTLDKKTEFRISYYSDTFKEYFQIRSNESDLIIYRIIKFYKVQIYLRIIRLIDLIKKIDPLYEVTDMTVKKIINDISLYQEEMNEMYGPIEKIILRYV